MVLDFHGSLVHCRHRCLTISRALKLHNAYSWGKGQKPTQGVKDNFMVVQAHKKRFSEQILPASQVYACMLTCFSHVQLFVTLWTVVRQVTLSMAFSRQKYWNGLPCTPPGDLLYPATEPASLTSPTLAIGIFTTNDTWEAPTKSIARLIFLSKNLKAIIDVSFMVYLLPKKQIKVTILWR